MSDTNEMQAWVARTIRAEASARGVNIHQLALRSGIPDKTLRRALDCERPLHLEQMVKVSTALGISLTFLVTEAERRMDMAAPNDRASAKIESDLDLTRQQKTTLLGDSSDSD